MQLLDGRPHGHPGGSTEIRLKPAGSQAGNLRIRIRPVDLRFGRKRIIHHDHVRLEKRVTAAQRPKKILIAGTSASDYVISHSHRPPQSHRRRRARATLGLFASAQIAAARPRPLVMIIRSGVSEISDDENAVTSAMEFSVTH